VAEDLEAVLAAGVFSGLVGGDEVQLGGDRREIGGGGSIAVEQKRPRGRPRTGVHPMRGLRMPADLEARIGAWIECRPIPSPPGLKR
jgi:hypothetical protein